MSIRIETQSSRSRVLVRGLLGPPPPGATAAPICRPPRLFSDPGPSLKAAVPRSRQDCRDLSAHAGHNLCLSLLSPRGGFLCEAVKQAQRSSLDPACRLEDDGFEPRPSARHLSCVRSHSRFFSAISEAAAKQGGRDTAHEAVCRVLLVFPNLRTHRHQSCYHLPHGSC